MWRGAGALFAAAVLGLALVWRLEEFDRRPLWLDELSTARVVAESPTLATLVAQGARDDNLHPPLAYLGSWIAAGSDPTPARLRAPAVLAGVASIALVMALGSLLFGGPAGLLGGFLLAVSMHHVDYSQEARPYMASVALTAAMYLALVAFQSTRQRAALGAFVLSAVLALYTYHLAILHAAVAAGVGALDVLGAARKPRGELVSRIRAYGIAFAAIAIAYLPQVENLHGFLASSGAEPNHVLDLAPDVLHAIADRWVSGPAWPTVACELGFVAGLLRLARRRDAAAVGLVGWLAAPFLVFALVPFSKYFDLRFLISALPPFFLIAAAGLDAIARSVARRVFGREDLARALHAAILLGVAAALFVPALRLHAIFRESAKRCGDIVRDRELFLANDRLCADHLLLSTIAADHQFAVRKLGRFVAVPPRRLDELVGHYRFADGRTIAIWRSGDHLVARIDGRFEFALVAESDTVFHYRVDHRGIRFERAADGRAEALVVSGGGKGSRAVRAPVSEDGAALE